MRVLVFFGVLCTLVVLTHGYIWRRVFRDTRLGPTARRRGAVLMAALGVMLLLGLVLGRVLPRPWSPWFAWPSYVWMGLVFLVVPGLALTDLGARIAAWLERRAEPPHDPDRRALLHRGAAALASLGALGTAGVGVHSATAAPRLREFTIPVPRLPDAFRGLRVAHVTDIHVGPTIGREFVAEIVRRINELKPDLVAVTGDLVDGRVPNLAEHVAPLAELRSTYGTYFVTGNHEFYSGAEPWVTELRRLGLNVLRNERVTLTRGDAQLDVVGVEDWRAGDFGGQPYDLDAAVAGRDPDRAALLLSHQPRCIEDAARHGLDVVLCGHTHGGQMWPATYLVKLIYPYAVGLHAHTDRTWIYVHPGTGWWGPPMRVAMPAEIALVTLA